MFKYLTPDTPASGDICRSFAIPAELLHIFMGALDVLTRADIYEEFGTMTAAEVAQEFMRIIHEAQSTQGDCMIEVGQVVWLVYHPFEPDSPLRLCDGSYFAKADYPTYWSYLVAGGSSAAWERDTDTFYVPNLINRFILGESDEPGGTGGEETHTLTTGEIPAHTHTEVSTGITGLFVAPGEVPAIIAPGATVTGSTGGGGDHNNMPPYQRLLPYVRIRP